MSKPIHKLLKMLTSTNNSLTSSAHCGLGRGVDSSIRFCLDKSASWGRVRKRCCVEPLAYLPPLQEWLVSFSSSVSNRIRQIMIVSLQVTKSFPVLLMGDISELAEVQNQQLTRKGQRLQTQNVHRSPRVHAGLGRTTLSNNSLKDQEYCCCLQQQGGSVCHKLKACVFPSTLLFGVIVSINLFYATHFREGKPEGEHKGMHVRPSTISTPSGILNLQISGLLHCTPNP